ncbi:WD repeat-containing protein 87 [Geranomyces variabilis]|uniref:WD repeat-containing protein 87 n=1 Tax=Geranomyces variabilis TaxID=109894 RepID=A0AAD5XQL0_9FUNG|nr:WD repeat-containing protein 87 [Geranomyces variabilis]
MPSVPPFNPAEAEQALEPSKSDELSVRNLGELGASTHSLDSDGPDNLGSSPPPSDYVLMPWHIIKKKLQARAAATASGGGAVLPTTMPHGFQLSRWLYHQRPTVRSAIYIPGIPDRIASVDSHNVNVWKNETKVSSIPLIPPPKTPKSPLAGLSRWLFVPSIKALFIATAQLELKLLNTSFEQVAAVSSSKPVLSFEFLESASELITGGVGNIRVWRIKKSGDLAFPFQFDGCRLTIQDLQEDDWVSHTVYSTQNNHLYAGVGNMIYVYDYRTGERVESMREVHELSITAMAIFEPFGFLITASRDCTIKIFNRQNNLIQRLHEHTHAVTGICLVPLPQNRTGRSVAALAATPFFLSCSLDGTVRMWNADLGVCVYSLQTPSECLGLQWMKGDSFLHFAKDRISVWNLNRFYTSFTFTRSPVSQLLRVEVRNRPARILAVAEDASLRIISPVTGIVLTIGFPVMEDMVPVASVYDLPRNRTWLLLNSGDLALYSTGTNPCEIINEVRHTPGHARICCMAGLSPRGLRDVLADRFTRSGTSTVFGLWGGCDAGQIVLVDVRDPARQQSVVQAHAGEITAIAYDADAMRLYSSGKDRVVKVWAVEVPLASGLGPLLNSARDGHDSAENAYADALDLWTADATSATIQLSLISAVTIPDGFVTRIGWEATSSTLACATDTMRIVIVSVTGSATLKTHARDDEHTRRVTGLAYCKASGIVASGSLDGTVKIWDGTENILLREIQFAYPVTAVQFANPRGDLLVALPEEVVAVRVQDYLPGPQLRTVLDAGPWVDDIVEDAATFDSGLDFWGLYRGEEESETTPWHVRKPDPHTDDASEAASYELEKRLEQRIEERERERALLRGRGQSVSITAAPIPLTREMRESRIQSRRVSREPSFLRRPSYNETLLLWGATMGQSALIQQQIIAAKGKGTLWGDVASLTEEEEEDEGATGAHRSPRGFKPHTNRNGQIQEAHMRPRTESPGVPHGPRARRGGIFEEMGSEDDIFGETNEGLEHPRPQSAPPLQDHVDVLPPLQGHFDVSAELNLRLTQTTLHPTAVKTPTSTTPRPLTRESSSGKAHVPTSPSPRLIPQKELIKDVKDVKHVKKRHRKDDSKESKSEPAAVSAEFATPEEAADRQAAIRRGMERLGILPNSMVAGQTVSVLTLKKAAEAQQRKEKDKAMLDNARAMVQRRRAERVARGEVGPAFDAVAEENEEVEDPGIKAQKAEDGRRLRREVSEREARYKGMEPPALPVPPGSGPVRGPEKTVAPALRPVQEVAASSVEPPICSTGDIADEAVKAEPGVKKRAPPPDLLPESRKALAKRRIDYKDIAAEGVLTVLMPDDTGLVHIDYSSSQRPIPVQIIPPRGKRAPPLSRAVPAVNDANAIAQSSSEYELDQDVLEDSLTRVVFERRAGTDRAASRASISRSGPLKDRRTSSPGAPYGSSTIEPTSVAQSLRDVRMSHQSLPYTSRAKLMSEPSMGVEFTHEVVMERIVPELQGILTAFWFPGMGGREVNFSNIMQVLFEVLKTGYWSEKAEASDALLLLYNKFKDEFQDPLQDFIIPQLESLSDRDWQTRLRLCQNLVKYGVYAAPLIQALMARLLDENADVRQAAMRSLAHFGIDTSHSLRSTMQQLNMLPMRATSPGGNWLDILLARMRARQKAAEAESIRYSQKWLTSLVLCNGDGFRPPSSYVTLVPPEVRAEGDCAEFVMPVFADATKAGTGAGGQSRRMTSRESLSPDNSTLLNRLIAKHPGVFKFSVSRKLKEDAQSLLRYHGYVANKESSADTTRSPRAGEVPGESYVYTTREEFLRMVEQNGFIEHAEFSGNLYGTPFSALEAGDKRVILDLEMNGVKSLQNSGKSCLYIFVAPPSIEVLRERLTGRGSENESSLNARLAAATSAMDYSAETPCPYDHIIVNGDDLEAATLQLEEAIFGSSSNSKAPATPAPDQTEGAEAATTPSDPASAPASCAAADSATDSTAAAVEAPLSSAPAAASDLPNKKKSKTCSIL